MLDSFRKASKSWPIKIMFVFLIASFGIWGIGDVVRQRAASQPAIVVGKQEVSAREVVDEFRRDTERVQAMFGGKITMQQARQFGLLQRTIEQIVSRNLLDQASTDLKFTVDDDSLRQVIQQTPAFQNELKMFDKSVYQRVLSRAGFSEKQFVAMERRDITRDQLVQMVTGGIVAPAVQADPLFRYRQEQRAADTVVFSADKVSAPAKPDDATLQAYHQAHAAQFMAPELRGLTAIVLRTADTATDIKPSDADIEKSYQVRLGEFQKIEKRAIQQVTFPDQGKAKAFADAVHQGKDFAAEAKTEGKDVLDLGTVDKTGLPLEVLADAAFALPTPGVTDPVQSPLGWHVLRITSITAGNTKPLAEVRGQIIQSLVNDEALTRLYTLSTKLEDSIGSGASLDEAAGTLNIKPIKVAALDDHGQGADGKPVPGLPTSPTFLQAAFTTGQGSTSDVTQMENNAGYFVLHVDSVTPPALKPFASIKDEVLAAWSQDQKEQTARKQAEAAAERVKKGEAITAVAGTLKVETTKPFARTPSETTPLPPMLVSEMFKAQLGGVAVVALPGGSMVARLKSVIPADPQTQAAALTQTRRQLSQAIAADVMQQYVAALEKDYGVTIHNALIEQQFGEK
jgi:peptidyl-prolyl cis-trans isomerase D